MDDYVSKPVDPDELYRILAKWIGQHKTPPGSPNASPAPAPEPESWADRMRRDGVIDVEAALPRFRGDADRLQSVLARFAESQADAAAEIQTALAKGDFAAAQRLAHTLKGLAGTLGATRLQEAALALETVLKTSDMPRIRRLLPGLEQCLRQVVDAGRQAEPPSEPTPLAPANQVASREELTVLLPRLAVLLRKRDPGAKQFVTPLSSMPVPPAVSEDAAQLGKLIRRYAFKEALTLLASLAEFLGISLATEAANCMPTADSNTQREEDKACRNSAKPF
jgi:HPt (histidine-containing phosphotransfer) domain-containing protein